METPYPETVSGCWGAVVLSKDADWGIKKVSSVKHQSPAQLAGNPHINHEMAVSVYCTECEMFTVQNILVC